MYQINCRSDKAKVVLRDKNRVPILTLKGNSINIDQTTYEKIKGSLDALLTLPDPPVEFKRIPVETEEEGKSKKYKKPQREKLI